MEDGEGVERKRGGGGLLALARKRSVERITPPGHHGHSGYTRVRSLSLSWVGTRRRFAYVVLYVLHSRIFRSGKSLWDFYIHPHSSRNRPPAIFLGEFFLVWPSFSASLSVQALFELLLPAKGHWVGGFYRRGREERGGPQPVAIRDQGGSNATTAKVFFFSSSRLLLL